jgi:hypothetical protein
LACAVPERELRLHNDAQQPGCRHPIVTYVPHAYAGDADCLLVLAPGEVQTGEWQYHVGVIAPFAQPEARSAFSPERTPPLM